MTVERGVIGNMEQVRFLVPREQTLYANYSGENLPFPVEPFVAPVLGFSSTRQRHAGRAFKRARESRGLTKDAVRSGFRDQTKIITLFEAGEATVSLPHVLSVAERHLPGEDFDIKELREHAEEAQWIATLTRPDMTLGRAVRLLRLHNVQTVKDFAKEAGIGRANLSLIELGRKDAHPATINQIIKVASIDPEGIPAQMIRLLSQKREAMSLMELKTCTFGELSKYLRQLRGYSLAKFGELLTPRKEEGFVHKMEKAKSIKDIMQARQIVSALDVTPQSALAKIYKAKIEKPQEPVADDLLTQVFTGEYDGQFVFAEHIHEEAHFQQAKPEKLLRKLDTIKKAYEQSDTPHFVVNAMLTFLRKQSGKTQLDVADKRDVSSDEISRIERNEAVPLDITVINILNGLGYDIHDPITSYILDMWESIEKYSHTQTT